MDYQDYVRSTLEQMPLDKSGLEKVKDVVQHLFSDRSAVALKLISEIEDTVLKFALAPAPAENPDAHADEPVIRFKHETWSARVPPTRLASASIPWQGRLYVGS